MHASALPCLITPIFTQDYPDLAGLSDDPSPASHYDDEERQGFESELSPIFVSSSAAYHAQPSLEGNSQPAFDDQVLIGAQP